MRLTLTTSLICIVYLMLRRLPTTLSFLGARALPSSRAYVRTFASAEPIVSADERARALIAKLNLSLGKRTRLAPGSEVKAVYTPSTTTSAKVISESAGPQSSTSAFGSLGLSDEIVNALNAQGINVPTPVQAKVITRILSGENLVMAASTGSGKTLAYTLPCIQELSAHEQQGYVRRPKRPRVLVLVPTRELARQVLDNVKMIGHYSKVASTAVLGGEQYGLQKIQLDRLVDVVVASPGRLMQHKQQGNVFFSQVRHVIIDEVDTMLTQGFGPDIRAILRSVVSTRIAHAADKAAAAELAASAEEEEENEVALGKAPRLRKQIKEEVKPAQVVMATATLTKAVKLLLDDVKGGFNLEYSDPSNATPRQPKDDDQRIKINVVEVDGVHRSLPNVEHVFEQAQRDKLVTLRDVLARHRSKGMRTLIFCNTVQSCRAVEYAINQDAVPGGSFGGDEEDIHATSYHGDLNSLERAKNLERFRSGQEQYMVCSDIAARGLDIPETAHVVMFDFPLNPVDYLHRAGRCGRAGRKGLVTALVAKRDQVLSEAIEQAISKGLPIDSLSSDKKDYTGTGKLAKAFKAPREADTPEMREHRQRRLEFNISRSKQSKLSAEAASGTAAAPEGKARRVRRFGLDRGESRGRPLTRNDDHRSRSTWSRQGGRSGARMRSPSPSRGAGRGSSRGSSADRGRREAAPAGDAKPFRAFRSDSPERSSRSSSARPASAGRGRGGRDDGRKSRSGGTFGKARSSSPRGSSARPAGRR